MRGLTWVFYPTTLLAQSDSCIGAKSSINSGEYKNILDINGSFYSFEGERLGQGRDSVRKFLKNNPDLTKKIESLILNPPEENQTIETDIMEATG